MPEIYEQTLPNGAPGEVRIYPDGAPDEFSHGGHFTVVIGVDGHAVIAPNLHLGIGDAAAFRHTARAMLLAAQRADELTARLEQGERERAERIHARIAEGGTERGEPCDARR